MKVCRKCGAEHERKHAWCGACFRRYHSAWQNRNRERVNATSKAQYEKNRGTRLAYAAEYRVINADSIKTKLAALREQKREIVRIAKDVPCADCGNRWPPVAMDFDHIRGVKKYNIAHMAGGAHSVQALLDEIAKCEVVCACCHRIRTDARLREAA